MPVVVVVAVVALVVGVTHRGAVPHQTSTPRQTAPRPSPTPLRSLDLSGLPIDRGPFCDRLGADDVRTALGEPVQDASEYDSGQRATLAPGLRDVAHEYDCTYRAASGAQARVWVFAQPVTRPVAASLARAARRTSACRVLADAPAYGRPSASTLCRTRQPNGTEVTLRGLFGDAWLTCRLSQPGTPPQATTARRGERWCVRVATRLGARP